MFVTWFSKERMMPVNVQGKTFKKEQQGECPQSSSKAKGPTYVCLPAHVLSFWEDSQWTGRKGLGL